MRMVIKRIISVIMSGGLLLIVADPVFPSDGFSSDSFTAQQKIESHIIVNLFMDAVDRGEVVVFNQSLQRSNVKPVQIAYAYELDEDVLSISIYSVLVEPVLVPHYEQFLVDGVSVALNRQGNILAVKAHVQTKE